MLMISIAPTTALEHYQTLLDQVKSANPVVLTEDDQEKYIILDLNDYKKLINGFNLLTDLTDSKKLKDSSK